MYVVKAYGDMMTHSASHQAQSVVKRPNRDYYAGLDVQQLFDQLTG